MLSKATAKEVAMRWVDVWNSLSIQDYESLFSDDAVEISTLANRIIYESHGSIKGKKSLIFYWEIIRTQLPDYRYDFKHFDVYNDTVIIHFTFASTNTPCIAKISLNKSNKINKLVICHI